MKVIRVLFIISVVALFIGAPSAFAARDFTIRKVERTKLIRWTCKDGHATGVEESRREARKAARAECGHHIVFTDPTGPEVTVDGLNTQFSGAYAERMFSTSAEIIISHADASGRANEVQVGGRIPIGEYVSLDLGLFYGFARARRGVTIRDDGSLRRGVQEVDFDLYGGDAAVRVYLGDGDRLRPWTALGVRQSFAEPHNERIELADGLNGELPTRGLVTVEDTSTFFRAGVDFRWSESRRVTLSGEYGRRGSWSARVGIGYGFGQR